MKKEDTKKVGNYKYLSDMTYEFRRGYILIEDMLFLIGNNKSVEDSWDVDGKTYSQMLISARERADISNKTLIVIDDEDVYSAATVADEEELVDAEEAFWRMEPEEREGYEDLIDYFGD